MQNHLILHQYRLHIIGNGFKIVQKSFTKSSSNLQEANHLGFTCQQCLIENDLGFRIGGIGIN